MAKKKESSKKKDKGHENEKGKSLEQRWKELTDFDLLKNEDDLGLVLTFKPELAEKVWQFSQKKKMRLSVCFLLDLLEFMYSKPVIAAQICELILQQELNENQYYQIYSQKYNPYVLRLKAAQKYIEFQVARGKDLIDTVLEVIADFQEIEDEYINMILKDSDQDQKLDAMENISRFRLDIWVMVKDDLDEQTLVNLVITYSACHEYAWRELKKRKLISLEGLVSIFINAHLYQEEVWELIKKAISNGQQLSYRQLFDMRNGMPGTHTSGEPSQKIKKKIIKEMQEIFEKPYNKSFSQIMAD